MRLPFSDKHTHTHISVVLGVGTIIYCYSTCTKQPSLFVVFTQMVNPAKLTLTYIKQLCLVEVFRHLANPKKALTLHQRKMFYIKQPSLVVVSKQLANQSIWAEIHQALL